MNVDQVIELLRIAQATPQSTEPPLVQPSNTSSLWEQFLQPGTKVLIRTVTHIDTGIVVACDGQAVVLSDAAWIPDTGRWTQALETGLASGGEVEPYAANVIVNLGSVIEITTIPVVPTSQR
jgi:hypothetical protein